MSKITDDGLNPVWHRMLYSCNHMATVGVKGLSTTIWNRNVADLEKNYTLMLY